MRQRKIKNIDEKLKLFGAPLVENPWNLRGRWRGVFVGTGEAHADCSETNSQNASRASLYLEIGCGKGRFITKSAAREPEVLFIGFEGQESVLLRALQRAYVGVDTPTRELNDIAMAKVHSNEHGGTVLLCSANTKEPSPVAVERNREPSPVAVQNLRFCSEYIMDMNDYFAENELDGIFLNFSDPWPKARQEKRRLTSPRYLDGYSLALSGGGYIRFKTDNDALFSYSVEQFQTRADFDIVAQTDDLHASEFAEASIRTEYELRFTNLNKKIHYLEALRR